MYLCVKPMYILKMHICANTYTVRNCDSEMHIYKLIAYNVYMQLICAYNANWIYLLILVPSITLVVNTEERFVHL